MSALAYEERYVVFLDILGFKELVSKSEANPEILHKLTTALNAMNIFREMDELLHKLKQSKENSSENLVEISTFSDSVIISTRADTIGLLLVTSIAQIISCNLFYLGIFSRGAISKGLLIHTDNMVLGSALIKAYELENKAAIYPRVIVDECVLKDIAADKTYNVYGASVIPDFDGIWFINYVALAPLLIASQLYPQNTNLDLLGNARAGLKELWSMAKDLGVKAKIGWLVNYINSKAESLGVTRVEVGVVPESSKDPR